MTQGERIIKYLEDYGSITPMQAFSDLGITKLSTRIGELERVGYRFTHQPVKSKNRYGEDTRYMMYKKEEN